MRVRLGWSDCESGLAMRQRVTANNIANIQTPGFHAGKVKFEGALQSALANGSAPDMMGRLT